MLWGKGEEPISTSALNFHDPIFMNFDHFQFRQDEPGLATLLVTRATGVDDVSDVLHMAQRLLQQRVGDSLAIEVRLTEPGTLLSRRGKVVTVDQRLGGQSGP